MPGTTTDSSRLGGRRGRLAIVLVYALLSLAWIAATDGVVHLVVPDSPVHAAIEIVAGVVFALLTSSLLWALLIARDLRLARQQATLVASEERYRMLAERSHDVIYRMRVRPALGFDYVSPSIERLSGHPPADFYADPDLCRSLVHPADQPALARSGREGTEEPVIVRWLRPDGTVRWTEHRLTAVRDAAGEVVAIEGAARDVTDRIHVEGQRAVLLRAIEHSPVGVALIGGSETGYAIQYVNPALLELTRATEQQLLGRSVFAFAASDGPVLDGALEDRLRTGEPFEMQVAVGPPGDPLSLTFIVSPQVSADGEVEAILTFVPDRSDVEARTRAEAILRASMDASPLAMVTLDLDGVVLGWNRAAEALLGWSAAEAIGRPVPYLDEAGWAATAERRRQLLAGTAEASVIRVFGTRAGGQVTCRVSTGVIRDAAHRPLGYVSLVNDLTEALRREEWNQQLRRAIDHAAESVVITDLDGSITYVNPAFELVSGYTADELLGRNPRALKSGKVPSSVYEEMWRRLTAGEVWRGILVNRRKDGSLYEEEATLSPVLGADGRPTAYVGVKRDLTLERRLAAGLSTELMDRAAVEDAMRRIEVREIAELTAQSVCEALAGVGDIDNVELVYLPPGRSVAVPLACVATSIPVHLGEPLAAPFGAYLRERATSGPWSDNHVEGRVDPRIDLAAYLGMVRVGAPVRYRGRTVAVLIATTHAPSPDAWIARHQKIVSELATHAGPLLGPQLATHDLGSVSADEIRQVIDEGAFAPVFQPVCDLASRQPVGWEAFTRFADGTAPVQRFADARATGLGDELEIAVARRAVEAFELLGRSGWLSINVSPALVMSGHASRIAAAARPLVLELTEAVDFDDYARLRGAVDLLGPDTQLAVDDSGAGYASLRHVLELRPDFVKLDPAFVADIADNETSQAMVAGMVHYAQDNGTRIIAEGIETEAQRRALLRLGVHLGQGYLLGVPSATGAPAVARTGARRLRAVHPAADLVTDTESAAG